MSQIKSITVTQTDTDNYIELVDNQRVDGTNPNRPANTTNKLYANSTSLYWEDNNIVLKVFDANGNRLH